MTIPAMGTDGDDTYFIAKTLSENSEVFRASVPTNNLSNSSEDSIDFALSQDLSTATVSMELNGSPYSAILHGETTEITVDDSLSGYVSVFEGVLISTAEDQNSEDIPVIADVTFTQDELFVALTAGEATETANPIIKFYGILSEELGRIATKNSEQHMQNASTTEIITDEELENGIAPAAYDTSIKYQADTNGRLGSYICAKLSLFHPDYAGSSGNAYVHAKVNTDSTGVLNYLRLSLGYNNVNGKGYALSAAPNRFEISVEGQDDSFAIIPNAYVPQDEVTSFPLVIPVYAGPKIGFQTVTVNCITSSTLADTDKYNSSCTYDNVVRWDMSKDDGWESDEFDGSYSTDTGMSVYVGYSIHGNIQTNTTETIGATARIRYEYYVQSPTAVVAMNINTPTISVDAPITLIPLT